MKIGIVTHTLANNYGGLLQAFALQKVLKTQGHDAWIFQKETISLRLKVLRVVRGVVFRLMNRFYVSEKDKKELSANMIYFAEKYINPKTPKLRTIQARSEYLKKEHFDALVVGSDQVWRPIYVKDIEHFFLNFAENTDVKRISYAASFGVDNWEFTEEQTVRCKELIHGFSAVSVREDTGVSLCKDYLDTEATQVLDPTLLLEKEEYEQLVQSENEPPCEGDVFCYILDTSKQSQDIIRVMETQTGYHPYYCMPKRIIYSEMTRYNKAEFKYPPVTRWLRSIIDAKMVITDSFHGCVFSIIFNKPFWVVVNKSRGATRFYSLLHLFGLQDRMINCETMENIQWNHPIDWSSVNASKIKWRKKSMDYLSIALS